MERWVGSVGGVLGEDEHAVLWWEKAIAHYGKKGVCKRGIACGRGSTRKNVIFSNSLGTNSEYPNSLKYMSI